MTRPYDFSKAITDQARLRQAGKCAVCGRGLNNLEEHAHHVIPNQAGNPKNPLHDWLRSADNCVVLCDTCHGRVHENSNYRSGAVAPPSYYEFSHGERLSSAHKAWVAALDSSAEALYAPISHALKQLEHLHGVLLNKVNLYSSEHAAQLNLSRGTLAGYLVSQFNSKAPETVIWVNAYGALEAANREIRAGRPVPALRYIAEARLNYVGALKLYIAWKNGIGPAGKEAQKAIVETAVVVATITVGLIAAFGTYAGIGLGLGAQAGAVEGSVASTERATEVVLNTIAKADQEILEIEAIAEAQEIAAETGQTIVGGL